MTYAGYAIAIFCTCRLIMMGIEGDLLLLLLVFI